MSDIPPDSGLVQVMVVSETTWGVLHLKELAQWDHLDCGYHISVFSLLGKPVQDADVYLQLKSFPGETESYGRWLLYPDKVRAQRIDHSDVGWGLTFREEEREEMVRIFLYTKEGNCISRHLLVRTEGYPHVNLQYKYVTMPVPDNTLNARLPYLSLGCKSEPDFFSGARLPAISPFPSSSSNCVELREEEVVHQHFGKSPKRYERRRWPSRKHAARPTPGSMDPCQGGDEYFVCRKGERLIIYGFGASTDAIVSHGMA